MCLRQRSDLPVHRRIEGLDSEVVAPAAPTAEAGAMLVACQDRAGSKLPAAIQPSLESGEVKGRGSSASCFLC